MGGILTGDILLSISVFCLFPSIAHTVIAKNAFSSFKIFSHLT